MAKVTLQSLFNKAYRGLAKQGFKKSMRGIVPTCAYRGANGTKCAIGHLIDDEAARQADSRDNSSYPRVQDLIPDSIKAVLSVELGAKLQECHDFCDTPKEMKANLKDFAKKYNLKVPKL